MIILTELRYFAYLCVLVCQAGMNTKLGEIHVLNASVRSSAHQLLNKTTITGENYEKTPKTQRFKVSGNCPKSTQQTKQLLLKRICKKSGRTTRVCNSCVGYYRHRMSCPAPAFSMMEALLQECEDKKVRLPLLQLPVKDYSTVLVSQGCCKKLPQTWLLKTVWMPESKIKMSPQLH